MAAENTAVGEFILGLFVLFFFAALAIAMTCGVAALVKMTYIFLVS